MQLHAFSFPSACTNTCWPLFLYHNEEEFVVPTEPAVHFSFKSLRREISKQSSGSSTSCQSGHLVQATSCIFLDWKEVIYFRRFLSFFLIDYESCGALALICEAEGVHVHTKCSLILVLCQCGVRFLQTCLPGAWFQFIWKNLSFKKLLAWESKLILQLSSPLYEHMKPKRLTCLTDG